MNKINEILDSIRMILNQFSFNSMFMWEYKSSLNSSSK